MYRKLNWFLIFTFLLVITNKGSFTYYVSKFLAVYTTPPPSATFSNERPPNYVSMCQTEFQNVKFFEEPPYTVH